MSCDAWSAADVVTGDALLGVRNDVSQMKRSARENQHTRLQRLFTTQWRRNDITLTTRCRPSSTQVTAWWIHMYGAWIRKIWKLLVIDTQIAEIRTRHAPYYSMIILCILDSTSAPKSLYACVLANVMLLAVILKLSWWYHSLLRQSAARHMHIRKDYSNTSNLKKTLKNQKKYINVD